MTATAGAACSTSTAEAAPRETASIPNAPVPANRSRTLAPSTRSPRTPNSASLTRSLVGLVSLPGTARNRRPPRRPPTTRTLPPEKVVGGGVISPGGPKAVPPPTNRLGCSAVLGGGAAVAGPRPGCRVAGAACCTDEGGCAVRLEGLVKRDALVPDALEGVAEGLAEALVADQQRLGVAAGRPGARNAQVEEDDIPVDQQVQGLDALDHPDLEPGLAGQGGHPLQVRLVLEGVAVEDGAELDPGGQPVAHPPAVGRLPGGVDDGQHLLGGLADLGGHGAEELFATAQQLHRLLPGPGRGPGPDGQRLHQALEGQVAAPGLLGLGRLQPADGLVRRHRPEAGVPAAGDLGAEPEPDKGADQLIGSGPGQAGLGGHLADLERPLGQHADIAAGLSLAEAVADEPVDQIRVTGLGQRSVLPRGDNRSEPQQ